MKAFKIGLALALVLIAQASTAAEQRMVKESSTSFSEVILDGIKAERDLRDQLKKSQSSIERIQATSVEKVQTVSYTIGEIPRPPKTVLRNYPRPMLIDVQSHNEQRLANEFEMAQ